MCGEGFVGIITAVCCVRYACCVCECVQVMPNSTIAQLLWLLGPKVPPAHLQALYIADMDGHDTA
jgi:hypothetical protein